MKRETFCCDVCSKWGVRRDESSIPWKELVRKGWSLVTATGTETPYEFHLCSDKCREKFEAYNKKLEKEYYASSHPEI